MDLRSLRYSAPHDPGCGGIRSGSIRFAIQISQPDHLPESHLDIRVKAGDILRNWTLRAFDGGPEIRKRCEVHADRQHILHDIG